jgi:hypothetical protein
LKTHPVTIAKKLIKRSKIQNFKIYFMPSSWQLYRIICILQMTLTAFILLTSLFNTFQYPGFSNIARLMLFLLILLLSIFAVNTLNNNYPDTPVAGKQKKTFNKLFLLNFLFLAVLFGFVIAAFREVNQIAVLLQRSIFELPFGMLISMIVYTITLLFQFIILYGLYTLRRVLYINFMKRRFEFEKEL